MKLVLDGAEFPFPDELTMGEQRLIKKYAGYGLTSDKVDQGDPDLLAAFCAISLKRANPQASDKQIEERVNNLAKVTVIEEESDASPPELIPKPESENGSSGPSSNGGTDASRAMNLVSTGTPDSDTGATSA